MNKSPEVGFGENGFEEPPISIAEATVAIKQKIGWEGKDTFFYEDPGGEALILMAEGYYTDGSDFYPGWSTDDFKTLLKEVGYPYEELIRQKSNEVFEKFADQGREIDEHIQGLLDADPELRKREPGLYEAAVSIGGRFTDFAADILRLRDNEGEWKMPEDRTEEEIALDFAAFAAQAEHILRKVSENIPQETLMSTIQQDRTPNFASGTLFDMACHAVHLKPEAYNIAEMFRKS